MKYSEEKKYKELGQRLEGSEFHLKLAGDTIWRLERKLERVTAFAETLVETVEIKESELVELEEHCKSGNVGTLQHYWTSSSSFQNWPLLLCV